MRFLDCSNHQRDIDLSKVPSDCFIFKATEGRGWKDSALSGFVKQARRLDKPAGFYHFVSQNNTPAQEADNLLTYSHANGRLDADVLVLDWEPSGSNPSPKNVEWAHQFLEHTSARVPNPLWTYMNLSTANGSDWKPITSRWPLLWLAHYPGNNKADGYNPAGARGQLNGSNEWQLAAWQFTDGGRLPGYGGNLDLNELYIPWWGSDRAPAEPRGYEPVVVPAITIPTIRENDPPVEIFHHHGGRVNDSRGNPRLGCVCMAITFPLVERRMLELNLIKYEIDVFQGGYNKGKVAASAGTHDMGGVIDVAQGISLAHRKVWAEFGVIMAPRSPEWGWYDGPHGHGGWYGCNHRTASLARQVRTMMSGYNGLVSNRRVNWESPKRTWQDAVRQVIRTAEQIRVQEKEKDPMPETREKLNVRFNHPGGSKYACEGNAPVIGADVIGPLVYNIGAVITGPEGSHISGRLAFLDRKEAKWIARSPEVRGVGNVLNFSKLGQTGHPECSIYVDVKCDQPGEVHIEQIAHFWR